MTFLMPNFLRVGKELSFLGPLWELPLTEVKLPGLNIQSFSILYPKNSAVLFLQRTLETAPLMLNVAKVGPGPL